MASRKPTPSAPAVKSESLCNLNLLTTYKPSSWLAISPIKSSRPCSIQALSRLMSFAKPGPSNLPSRLMKKIYFVRHGESEANSLGLSAGSEFDTPLTNFGREQARKAGQELKDKKIELIIASPMERTVETATIIAH